MGLFDESGLRIDLHVHHHFDGPVTVVTQDARRFARRAVLNIKEKEPMAGVTIDVDTTNEIATVSFVDDHGDPDAAQPDGTTITFSSDNPAVLGVGPDPGGDPKVGDLSAVAEGDANLSVAITNADGSPWGNPVDAVAIHVNPGAAVGAVMTLTGPGTTT